MQLTDSGIYSKGVHILSLHLSEIQLCFNVVVAGRIEE